MKIIATTILLSILLFSCSKEAEKPTPKRQIIKTLIFEDCSDLPSPTNRVARGLKNKRPKDTTVTYDPPPAYTGNNIIHLDFNGVYVSGQGWNNIVGGDFYSTPSSMSPFEQYNVFDTIKRAYSDFRTLVTLDESMYEMTPQAYRQKVAFTDDAWYGNVGGVAYANSFGTETFCFVFSKLLSNHTQYVALAGVHEAGHTLGLRHAVDGYYDSTGTWVLLASYTQGKNWMGAGYNYPYHVFEEWVYIASGAKQYQFNVINATLN